MNNDELKRKYREKIDEVVNNPSTIPGIFNYCDRWCERCSFTSRCTTFLMDEFREKNKNSDSDNADFWQDLSFIFEVTKDMLEEKINELGIDADEISSIADDLDLTKRKEVKSEAEKLSFEYALEVGKWLKNNTDYINDKSEQLNIIDNNFSVTVNDAIDVIQWYQYFITPKVARAYSSKIFPNDKFEDDDKQGSAKVALIAIDKSIKAHNFLLNNFAEKEDEILDFLVTLTKIKKLLLRDFPNAMDFIRPGFDEIK